MMLGFLFLVLLIGFGIWYYLKSHRNDDWS